MSFSHREFTDSLITQKLTLRQVVDFLYNMDIHDTNMNPIRKKHYGHKLLRYYVINTLQNVKDHSISHNSVHI